MNKIPTSKLVKNSSTMLLRSAIGLAAIAVLALCVFGLPAAIRSDNVGIYRPILLAMYLPALPFFFALHQAHRLLTYIESNQAFSSFSVTALKNIKSAGLIISGLYTAGMPYVYYAADRDDAPGVILLGLAIIFVAFVTATFAGVLQRLIQNAVDIKSENDLTV